jgi:hypothetical protein
MTASPAEAPPASQPSQRSRPTGGLTFKSPAEEEWGTPIGADLTPEQAGMSLDDQPAGSPSASDGWSDSSDEDDESDPTSSHTSSDADRPRVKPLSQKAQRLAARQAVKIAGSMAHQYLARDEAAQAVGLYLVDDESAAAIGDPLSRIAARHAPVDGAMANEDVADGIAAMMGVAHFVSKTIEKSSQAAALRNGISPAVAE